MVIDVKYGLSETCHTFFSALSTPTRLGILELLMDSPRNVTQLVEALDQEQSMISHNLKALARCGFVHVERKGKERIYSINRNTLDPLFKIIDTHVEKYCPQNGRCLKR